MKKSLLSILAVMLAALAGPVSAQSRTADVATYFSFLAPADLATLTSRGELSASGTQASLLPYGPRSPLAATIAADLSVPGATVAQEGWYLFARPTGEVDLKIYNTLNAVASMAGIQYYSLSQKQMQTLILESWRVDSVEKANKTPDPVFSTIPTLQKVAVFQKDNRLGDGFTELTYKVTDGHLLLGMQNLSELKYLFVPLVAPGNLKMLFIVIPLADKIAVYAAMEVKTASLLGFEHSKDENFRNRMRALAGWLGTRIGSLKD